MTQPASYNPRHEVDVHPQLPDAGTTVRLKYAVDRFPYCIIPAGETGEVLEEDGEHISVRLDVVHPELAEWDNCIIWTADNFDGGMHDMLQNFWGSVETVDTAPSPAL